MKKAVFALAVLMLLPVLSQAQSITGYIDYNYQKAVQNWGASIRVDCEVEDAIKYSGGGGASGTGGGGWHSSAHHWDTNILKQKAEEFSSRYDQIVDIIMDKDLDNTYEALVSIGEDPLLTALALGDKDRTKAILRSFSIQEHKGLFSGKIVKTPVAVVPWKVYTSKSSSGYGYSSYSYNYEFENKKVILTDEGAKKAQQLLKKMELYRQLIQQNGESAKVSK